MNYAGGFMDSLGESIMRWLRISVLALSSLLTGCGGGGTKQQIVKKLEGAKTGAEVRKLMGEPTDYDSKSMPILGKVEKLTYTASDGAVIVILHNDNVFSVATGTADEKEK
jgi:hypothetical protein